MVKKAGQIIWLKFIKTNLDEDKYRPALVLGRLPSKYNDWLICMISSNTKQYNKNIDNIIYESDPEFTNTTLKLTSVFRVNRLYVIKPSLKIKNAGGFISQDRLKIIKKNLISMIKRI